MSEKQEKGQKIKYLCRVNDLKDKTALVCGASQGIGKAIAAELAKAGATVILVSRSPEKLKAVSEALIKSKGQMHSYYATDFFDLSQTQNIAGEITKNHQIDILVNNAGGPPAGAVSSAKIEAFEQAFTAHLKTAHVFSMACLPHMKNNAWGRIINVISTSVKAPLKNLGVSNTIRGAMGNWSKTLATEVAPFNITVNNILPGATQTKRLENIIAAKAKKADQSLAQITEAMKSQVPMGRFAEPKEVGLVALFLASHMASYVTGINIPVDGGRTPCL